MNPDLRKGDTVNIVTDSYAGIVLHPAVVVGFTAKRVRVRMTYRTKLPKGWIEEGATALVPAYALQRVASQ